MEKVSLKQLEHTTEVAEKISANEKLISLIDDHPLTASAVGAGSDVYSEGDGLTKKKKNKVKLKSIENIDTISSTNKLTDGHVKLISKSNSLASVSSTRSSIFSYSYVVLLASFFSYMLASLLSSCFGVFFESMSTDLGWSHSRVAFVGSLLTALQDLAGPISSALTNHFGCRKTTIFGGLICALGIIGSAYASEFWLLGFLMGGVSGFGASLVLVSSVVVVTYYFEDKPSFAAGFTISGASMGQSIFTMIIIKLNEVYGRSGCFLILGGILLNIVVCGALFRPLKWELEDDEEDEDDEDDDDEDDDEEDNEDNESDESEDDKLFHHAANSNNDDTNKKAKSIRKSNTKESNLSELTTKPEEKGQIAPIASQEKFLKEENDIEFMNEATEENNCLKLYFHDFNNQMEDLFIMDNKNDAGNQVFYLDNNTGGLSLALANNVVQANEDEDDNQMSQSSQYMSRRSRKDFSSDPCMNKKSAQTMQMPSLGVSLISLNSSYVRQQQQQQQQQEEEENFHKNQNFSYFDRHHSLQLIRMDSRSSLSKHHQSKAKSELILKYNSVDSFLDVKQIQQEQQEELGLENADFVLLDAEEMITDCNSNLVLSSSQAAIYLTLNENETNVIDELAKANSAVSSRESLSANNEMFTDCLADKSISNQKTLSQRNSSNKLSSAELKELSSDTRESVIIMDRHENKESIGKAQKPSQSFFKFSSFFQMFSNIFAKKSLNNLDSVKANSRITSNSVKINNLTTESAKKAEQNVMPAISKTSSATPNPTLLASSSSANTNFKKNTFALDPTNFKLLMNHSDKVTPRFIIARCNCRQRNLQNMQRRNKSRRTKLESMISAAVTTSKLPSNSVNLTEINSPEPLEENNHQEQVNEETNKSQSYLTKLDTNLTISNNFNNSNSNGNKPMKSFDANKSQFKFRHFPNCPVSKLNRLKNMQLANQTHYVQTNASVNQNRRNNLYYVPSLFQNSYRFPLHFKNVYYYKSLINLNMRLKNLKSHGNHPATLAGVFNFNRDTTSPSATASQSQQPKVPYNVSFSCPDLNPKQFFIVKKNVISFKKLNEHYGGQVVPIKAIKRPMQILTINDLKELIPKNQQQPSHQPHYEHHSSQSHRNVNLKFEPNLEAASKVLNAGSILLTTSRDLNAKKKPSFQNKPLIIKFKTPISNKSLQTKKINETKTGLNDGSVLTVNSFNDKISNKVQAQGEDNKSPLEKDETEEEEEEEDDQEVDEDEDDDDDDDDDEEEEEEEEEECDNFFTRTKAGNHVYKSVWKPVVNSLKFIFYSISENLKLFRFFRFSVFAFCNFVLSFFYEAPFVFINSYMMNNELTESQAGSVTVAVGIVCIFSSIAYGYIGDSKRVNSIILYSVSLVLCGMCCCAVPLFIKNYAFTMILMVLMGALISVSDVLVPIICVNLVGYDDFVNAYGLMFFCQGLASLSGPPLLAIIVDYSGDYALSYYIIGIGIILSGLILSSVLCYNQYAKKKTKKTNKNLKSTVEKV